MWTYLFNARWLSFAFLQRSVAITTQYESNEETWSASRETQELTRTLEPGRLGGTGEEETYCRLP